MNYLMVKNNATCEMEIVAEIKSFGDALLICKLLNKNREEVGDKVHTYGITNNPMIWKAEGIIR